MSSQASSSKLLYNSSLTPISKFFEDKTTNNSFNLIYLSNSNWPLSTSTSTSKSPIKIINLSILDSSFNPPHKAHLNLTNLTKNNNKNNKESTINSILLILSIKNVDKELKFGFDANYEQRLEMIRLMALKIKNQGKNSLAEGSKLAVEEEDSVAVVCINEPSFVGKSKLIKSEVEKLLKENIKEGDEIPIVRLCFSQGKFSFFYLSTSSNLTLNFNQPLGWDTLIRFFDPKYYQPPSASIQSSLSSFFNIDKSTIVCARRGDISPEQEEEFLNSEFVKEWKDKVTMIDLDEEFRNVSSTEVREIIGRENGVERDKLLDKVLLKGVREIIDRDELYKKKENL